MESTAAPILDKRLPSNWQSLQVTLHFISDLIATSGAPQAPSAMTLKPTPCPARRRRRHCKQNTLPGIAPTNDAYSGRPRTMGTVPDRWLRSSGPKKQPEHQLKRKPSPIFMPPTAPAQQHPDTPPRPNQPAPTTDNECETRLRRRSVAAHALSGGVRERFRHRK